jgi:hypothetical protein
VNETILLKRFIEFLKATLKYRTPKLKTHLSGLVLIFTLSLSSSTSSSAQTPNLGLLEDFSIYTSFGAVANTAASHIYGNIGSHAGAISGFLPPSTVNGTIESANLVTAQCAVDVQSLYNEILAMPQTVFGHPASFGSGEIIFPGVYSEAGAGGILLDLTLDAQGDPCALFIFKFGGAFNTGATTNVKLINGASASNIFWVSAGAIGMAASTQMKGTLISSPGAVSMGAGGILEGRMLSTGGAISMNNSIITAKSFTTWNGMTNSDWFNNANWSDGVPTSNSEVIVPTNCLNMPIINGTGAVLLDIKIASGATLEIANSNQLDIYRDLDIQGSFIANTSTVKFLGDCIPTALNSSGTVSFYSVVVKKTSDVTVTSGLWELRGVMSILGGSFITNDALTVISDANGTGSIGEIIGVGISGEITMERYIDAGATNWRYLGSAVAGATIGDFNDDFITAGYPGSHFPNFGWVSVYTYDETLAPSFGYLAATDTGQIILPGQGIHVWSGDTITGTQPFVVDFNGVANQGDITFNVSYTNTGTPTEDGWNHIANPYPSTIDWDDSSWTKTNMANATYIYNPDNGQYATYVAGASTNGGSKYIPSQQAFWVTAFAAAPVLIAKEGVKSDFDHPFLKSEEVFNAGLKIRLSGNEEFDEAVVRHIDGATESFDHQFDANKYGGGWGLYPQVSLIDVNSNDLTVHSFENLNQEVIIPIRTVVFSDGVYSLEFDHVNDLDVLCLRLEDTYTGIIYTVEEETSLLFEMSDTTYAPRFNLILHKNYESQVIDNTCNDSLDGEIQIDFDLVSLDYTLFYSSATNIESDFADPLIITGLKSDIYTITVPALINSCGLNSFNFVVNEPSAITLEESIIDSENGYDGSISIVASGGIAPYEYLWENGANTERIENLDPGSYELTVTDANGCSVVLSYEIKSVFEVKTLHETDISFFYNMDDGIITLNNFSLEDDQEFIIHNADGKITDILALYLGDISFSYSSQHLSVGMYIITNSSSSWREKFVVIQ